jgi:hypothetical protein
MKREVCEGIVEDGLGTRSDISVLTEFGASAYRAMLRNGLQMGVVTAAVRYGAMHGSSVRGLLGRCSSMDHDRGGLVGGERAMSENWWHASADDRADEA